MGPGGGGRSGQTPELLEKPLPPPGAQRLPGSQRGCPVPSGQQLHTATKGSAGTSQGAPGGPQSGGGPDRGSFIEPEQADRADKDMGPLLLLCAAALAPSSFSVEQETEVLPEVSIAYRVLEVFPRSRRVLITCHAPNATPPITYSLRGSQDIEVAKKVMNTHDPASFSINVTLKSRPDLLTYTCQRATTWGTHVASAKLQMYWELWAKPVSQLQADFTLLDRGAGPRVEVSCQASSGSPPITDRLVRKDGRVHVQQTPPYRQPANFSFPLTQASYWYRCQAQNDISVQSSPFTLVPPGQLPKGPTFVLTASLTSITAITSGMLGWTAWTRL
ncbi:protein IL-40 [Glossophaga mutica]